MSPYSDSHFKNIRLGCGISQWLEWLAHVLALSTQTQVQIRLAVASCLSSRLSPPFKTVPLLKANLEPGV